MKQPKFLKWVLELDVEFSKEELQMIKIYFYYCICLCYAYILCVLLHTEARKGLWTPQQEL